MRHTEDALQHRSQILPCTLHNLLQRTAHLIPKSRTRDRLGIEWKAHSAKTRVKVKLGPDSNPWTTRTAVKLRGVGTSKRQHDLMNIGYRAWQNIVGGVSSAVADRDGPHWFVDISQCCSREPWGPGLPTLGCKTCIYSYHFDKILTGQCHASAMGWSSDTVWNVVTELAQKRLVGNAIFLPNLAVALGALIANERLAIWH